MSEKKPIGFDANQIPMNSMLGGMAFQSLDNVKISGGRVSDSVLPPSTFLKNSAQTLTNKLTTLSSNLNISPITIPQGNVPSTLSNGDIFITSGGIYAEINDSLVKLNNQSKYTDSLEVLIVGGGGGGGYANNFSGAGGGGAGGAQILKLSPTYGQQFSVLIGRGGLGGSFTSQYQGIYSVGENGFSTSFGQYVSLGGGGGAPVSSSTSGQDGGSGGGKTEFSGNAGRGTDGQGANGHYGNTAGAGSSGSPDGHIGGAGTVFFGTTYAAGGQGGLTSSAQWRQILTVGGNNAGSGGRGGPLSSLQFIGATGRPGVVIVAYPGPQRATGGTITTSNGFTFHTFTYSGFSNFYNAGTFVWLSGLSSYQASDLIGEAIIGVTTINE